VGDWDIFSDPASGSCFYSNRQTGESQWEPPSEVALLWESGGGGDVLSRSTMAGACTTQRVLSRSLSSRCGPVLSSLCQ
jgi:hypothetical protein